MPRLMQQQDGESGCVVWRVSAGSEILVQYNFMTMYLGEKVVVWKSGSFGGG